MLPFASVSSPDPNPNRARGRAGARLVAAVLIVLFGALPAAAADRGAPDPDEWSALRRTIESEMRERQIPGAAVAVIRDNRVVFAEGFGVTDIRSRQRVGSTTRFRIGSISKMMTAATILLEIDRAGAMDLHEPVGRYLPGLPPRIGRTTLHQLLSHRAGVADGLKARSLTDRHIFTEPDALFSYSNIGYAIAGRAAASVAGVEFEELLRRRVLTPLEMGDTSYEGRPGDAAGHVLRGGRPVNVAQIEEPSLHPAAFLYSNVPDLSRFAIAFMRDGGLGVSARMSEPLAGLPGESRSYGYGSFVANEDGALTVAHMGDERGGSAYLKMVPERNAAVIVLMNLPGRMPRTMTSALTVACGLNERSAEHDQPAPLEPHDIKELTGRYRNGHTLEIRRRGNAAVLVPSLPWYLRWHARSREMRRLGSDRFELRSSDGDDEPVHFTTIRDAHGRVEYLMIKGRAYRRE